MEIALLENIQRENLSPIEEAQAYKNFMIKMQMTQDEIAKRFGKSRSHITNLLGLLSLPQDVQNDVINGNISMSHARVLSKLESDEQIVDLSNKIKSDGLSVRDLEDMSRTEVVLKKKHNIKVKEVSTRYKIYESTLRDLTGNKVSVANGKVIIPFDSDADLDRVMEILNVEIGE